jgi:hypothetical protein
VEKVLAEDDVVRIKKTFRFEDTTPQQAPVVRELIVLGCENLARKER